MIGTPRQTEVVGTRIVGPRIKALPAGGLLDFGSRGVLDFLLRIEPLILGGDRAVGRQNCFDAVQLKIVSRMRERAAGLVSDYYRVAPREWLKMPYEVRTLCSLDSSEVTDAALAQTVCYAFKRQAGPIVLKEGDLFRICLQDHRILGAARDSQLELESLLEYVLTHELIHVVRFGQRLQNVDLPPELRYCEERQVEKTTRTILSKAGDPEMDRILFRTARMS